MPTDTAALKANLRQIIGQTSALLGTLEQRYNVKSIESEVGSFSDDLGELIQELLRGSGRLSKADFRRQMKSMLKDYAISTGAEGWVEGGDEIDDMGPEEDTLVRDFYKEQQGFVNDFADWLRDKDSDLDQVGDRVDLWASSMQNFGEQMKARAMGDPLLGLLHQPGAPVSKEPCDTCSEKVDEWHRLSYWRGNNPEGVDYTKRNGNDAYDCGHWDGKCYDSFYNRKYEMVIE